MKPIYEGKAKRLYTTDDPNVLRMEYKDEATAFNAEKKAEFENKGRLNTAITLAMYRMLETKGVETHLIDQIDEIAAIHRLDEIVFCSKDLSSTRIIKIMTRLIGSSVDFKIAPPESLSVIGSNSINTSGDLYTIHFNSIGKESNRRNKRLFDVVSSFLLLITFPFWFLFVKGHFNSVGDTLWVLLGFRTWVGYLDAEHREQPKSHLPSRRDCKRRNHDESRLAQGRSWP